MILILCLALAIICTVIAWMFWDEVVSEIKEALGMACGVLAFIAWVASIIMVICAVIPNADAKGQAAAYQETYYSLLYQLENDIYDNDNDIGKQELYTKITTWNSKVAKGKIMQDDFWFGIFWPDIYDELELIKLG